MFLRKEPFYGEKLLSSLGDGFDYTDTLYSYMGKAYAIFGDRGQGLCAERITALNLPKELLNKIQLLFIPNACHLPMIENPACLADALKSIL